MKEQDAEQLTLWSEEVLAKTCLSQENNEDLAVIEAVYSLNNSKSRESLEQSSLFGKTFQVRYPRIGVEILGESYQSSQVGKLKIVNGGGAGYLRNRTKDDFSVCYRILDTRFFGIPQRRRRIYLVACLGDQSRPEILFERDSVSRDSSQSGAQRKDVTAFANGGIGSYYKSDVAGALHIGGDIKGGGSTLIAGTLDTSYAKHYGCDNQHIDAGCPNFVLFENHQQDARYNEKRIAPTLNAKMGTGGGNVPLCVHASQDPIISENHTHALGANSTQAVCIAENVIGRQDKTGANGVGAKEEVSYTLNTVGVHSVAKDLSIRRLTPLECERLQGFPDRWTKIPYRGKNLSTCPDSPRYKALGNAVTVAVAEWVLKRLVKEVV